MRDADFAMDRKALQEHLQLAEAQLADAKAYVERQRQFIARLEELDQDSGEARDILLVFEDNLRQHESDRERILIELSRLPPS
jgi:hypothetical protein